MLLGILYRRGVVGPYEMESIERVSTALVY